MRSILVIVGSTGDSSAGRDLAEGYRRAAEAQGARVEMLDLAALNFCLELVGGLRGAQPLEPDLVAAQQAIARADHLVFVYPNWWGTYPARLKGFIDRTFLPGFAFQYKTGSPLPEPLLKGKTSRLIVTMDGPGWWYSLAMGRAGDRALVRSVLGFVGVRNLGVYHADRLRPRAKAPLDRHRAQVARWATVDARSPRRLQPNR